MQNSRPEEEPFDRNKRRINTPPIEPQEETNEFDDNFGNRVQNYNENGEYRFGNRNRSHGNGRERRFSQQPPYYKPYNGGRQDSISRNKDSYSGYKNAKSGYGNQAGAEHSRYNGTVNRNQSPQRFDRQRNDSQASGNRPNPNSSNPYRTANSPERRDLHVQRIYRHRRNSESPNAADRTGFRTQYAKDTNRPYKSRLDNNRFDKAQSPKIGIKRRSDKKKTPRPTNLMKTLRRLDFASPKILEQALRSGVIAINGQTIDNRNISIDKKKDVISVYGRELRAKQENIYVIMNKARCVAGSDEKSRATIYQNFYCNHRWFFPVGCLDKTASGIIILTTDKRHHSHDTSPIASLEKEYYCKIHKVLSVEEIAGLQKFLDEILSEDVEMFAVRRNARNMIISVTVTRTPPTALRVALKRFGIEILSFYRHRVGTFTTDDIPAGAWRRLVQEEVDTLNELAEFSAQRKRGVSSGEDNGADLRQYQTSVSLKEKMQSLYRHIFKS
ncbi:hypothetical protein MASR2M18_13220 [Ignavibacteria bacterium]|nr:hypothetical protein [Bacteroidota bacterium]MCZ2132307.1 hypothetical protein [Bacteroidota bacterium]